MDRLVHGIIPRWLGRAVSPWNGSTAYAAPRWLPLQYACWGVLLILIVFVVSLGQPDWLLRMTDSLMVLVAVSLLYALVLAIPFVPSVEIGLMIMLSFGRPGIAAAWLATLLGLNLAYAVGRILCADAADSLPQRLPVRLRPLLAAASRGGLLPAAMLGLLLNLPGNTVLGGGGGVSLAFGAGRLLSWPGFLLVVAPATAVVPLLVLFGLVGLEHLRSTGV